MNQRLETKVPERKIKEVQELSNLLKNKKTVLIASIRNLPASQFQEISKKLRGKAIVKVPKKNLIFRAIDNLEDEDLKKIKEKIEESSVLLFSDQDSFDLASELIENKSPAKAKPGQEAPEDIEIPAGPTELITGPAISDFGALGIQIQIEKGKITVKQSKIVAEKGKEISENAANMMDKLDIKPFSVGFVPLVAFDTKEKKLYSEINIDKKGAVEEIKNAFGKSLAFAVEINYTTGDTIKFLISKADINEKTLSNLTKEEKIEKKEKLANADIDTTDNDKTDKDSEKDSSEPPNGVGGRENGGGTNDSSENNTQTSEQKSEEEN